MRELLKNGKIARATHNIMAYRILSGHEGSERVLADNDEDGESGAGAKLAELLSLLHVSAFLLTIAPSAPDSLRTGSERRGRCLSVVRRRLARHGSVQTYQQLRPGLAGIGGFHFPAVASPVKLWRPHGTCQWLVGKGGALHASVGEVACLMRCVQSRPVLSEHAVHTRVCCD